MADEEDEGESKLVIAHVLCTLLY